MACDRTEAISHVGSGKMTILLVKSGGRDGRGVAGGHSRTKIQGFYGAGAEDASRNSPFVLEGDEPPVLLGSNVGPNAVETVLSALASCLTAGRAYNATARDINVESLSFALEGAIALPEIL